MSKLVWIVCTDEKFLKQLEECKDAIASAFSHSDVGCPSGKKICGKVYEHGCTDCWAEWLSQNVEVVDSE